MQMQKNGLKFLLFYRKDEIDDLLNNMRKPAARVLQKTLGKRNNIICAW